MASGAKKGRNFFRLKGGRGEGVSGLTCYVLGGLAAHLAQNGPFCGVMCIKPCRISATFCVPVGVKKRVSLPIDGDPGTYYIG